MYKFTSTIPAFLSPEYDRNLKDVTYEVTMIQVGDKVEVGSVAYSDQSNVTDKCIVPECELRACLSYEGWFYSSDARDRLIEDLINLGI